jgi:NADPH-dependent glutamate synthase beta subunit-like oxidoreductase
LFHLNKTDECLAPCRQKCPAQVNAPEFIRHLLKKDMAAAWLTIKERNPFPLSVGRTCPHPCENICRRNVADQGVAINHLARYIGEWEYRSGKHLAIPCAPDTGHKIAIVGGGPAGLACAYFLRRAGHRPEIFEAQPQLGGMLQYGIPAYRLPKKIVAWEIEGVVGLGVAVHTEMTLGRDFAMEELTNKGFKAIFLGLGAGITPPLGIPGETVKGVHKSLAFLSQVGTSISSLEGKQVIVIGESNTAMDCARTSIRLGAESVDVICPCERKEMSARKRDVDRAIDEGVRVSTMAQPKRIIVGTTGSVAGLAYCRHRIITAGSQNDKTQIKGSDAFLNADLIIAAFERKPDLTWFLGEAGAKYGFQVTRNATLAVEKFSQLAVAPNIFAAGDLHTGRATVIGAVAGGRLAARSIHHLLVTGKIALPGMLQLKVNPKSILKTVEVGAATEKLKIPEIPVSQRRRSFVEEVVATIDDDTALKEASRCLQCGTYCYDWAQAQKPDHSVWAMLAN